MVEIMDEGHILLMDGKQIYANLQKDVFLEIVVQGDDGQRKEISSWVQNTVPVWNTKNNDNVEVIAHEIASEEQMTKIKEFIKENKE